MKKLMILLFFFFVSCETTTVDNTSKNQEIFNRNIDTFKKSLEAFYAEDIEGFMDAFSDTLKWTGPDKKLMSEVDSKLDLQEALVGYTTLYDNHELRNTLYFAGSVYASSGEVSDDPNAIRVYGDWHHTHTESGKDVSHKWMAVIWFDEAGKIHQFNDFFDVAGFLVQHKE